MNTPQRFGAHNERGATLFVALIILVIISLLGVTALKNASVEEQMASNLLQKNVTFQASESAVEATIEDMANLKSVMQDGQASPITVLPVTGVDASITYALVGDAAAPGFSMGKGGGGFTAAHMMITSTGSITATGASTTTVHGVYRIAPGN